MNAIVRREYALEVLGKDWNRLLNNGNVEDSDPQWLGCVLLNLLDCALPDRELFSGKRRVFIYGRNPLSNWLLRELDGERYEVLIVQTGMDDLPTRAGLDIHVLNHLTEISCAGVDCVLITALDSLIAERHKTELRAYVAGLTVLGVDEAMWKHADNLRVKTMEDRFKTLCDYSALETRPVVIFVASNVYFNQLRMSKVLRDNGWATVALSLHYAKGAHQQSYFDYSFHIDLDILLPRLANLENVIIHTQGWLNAYHIPVLIDAFRSENVRHIVELMDVQSFFFPNNYEMKMASAVTQCWGEGAIDHIALQKRCERYLTEHADGLVLTGGVIHQEVLWPQDPACARFCNFPSYPLREFFSTVNEYPHTPNTDESWHMVFAGGIPPCNERHPHALFGDAQILPVIKRLLAQNISVDIYNNPTMIPERRLAAMYADYVSLARCDPRFNFGYGAYPWDLASQISDRHFGLMLYEFSGVLVGEMHFKAIVPSKFFQYLEAGLPVLVSDRFDSVCELVNRYGIGLVLSDGDIDRLDVLLSSVDYSVLRDNVISARVQLSMDMQIHRLENLYRGCV